MVVVGKALCLDFSVVWVRVDLCFKKLHFCTCKVEKGGLSLHLCARDRHSVHEFTFVQRLKLECGPVYLAECPQGSACA